MKIPLFNKLVIFFAGGAIVIGNAMLARGAYAAGPSFAFAHVRGDSTLDAANSKNVVAMGGGNGLYCFKLAFVPKNAVATIADDPTAPDQGLGFIEVALPPTALFTCAKIPKPDAVVATFKQTTIGGGQSAGGHAFYVYWTK
jgi:hypothetical protein